jgi:hypothetical protein
MDCTFIECPGDSGYEIISCSDCQALFLDYIKEMEIHYGLEKNS